MAMDNSTRHWESRIGRRLRIRDLHIYFAVVQWGSMAKAATMRRLRQETSSPSIGEV